MSITKRKVFYLSGFDPRGAPHYHGLYKQAAARYAELSGQEHEVSPRRRNEWQVHNHSENVRTDYQFLIWDDIVRRAWVRHPLRLIGRAFAMYVGYAHGCRWRTVFRLPRAPIVTLLYPLATMLLLPLMVTLLLSLAMPMPIAALIGIGITPFVLTKIKALWLLRFFVFNYRGAREDDPELLARLDQFAQEIHASFDAGYDEILLACHSNGSILAVPLLVRLARKGPLPEHFRVLTLGHCIPLVSHLNQAQQFRRDLAELADKDFYWCDIGFPPDGACYALTDPFLPYHPQHRIVLKLSSARFFRYYDAANYRRIRRNKYNLHFRYVMTGDRLSPLDYIKLTAGPQPLPHSVADYEAA